MFKKLMHRFERFTNPFPQAFKTSPPQTLLAFCLYYSRGFMLPIAVVGITSLLIAAFEVSLFAFLGQAVDWLSHTDKATFLSHESGQLWWMSAVLLLILPGITILNLLTRHQSLMGNYPMAIRFHMHQHLLNQSLRFYQDEFAGRIATKVMQTALAVRELMLKITDIMVYVVVYVLSMFILLFSIHPLLLLPIGVWFIFYGVLQVYYLPKLKAIAQAQAHARSTMTGRITDAYTNISTIKLFAHTHREVDYAKSAMNDFMKTVYHQFRLVTGLDTLISTMNYWLIFSVGATGIYLWLTDDLSAGALAVAISSAIRLNGMSHWVMWEVSSLFEQIGTVVDGMHMLALPNQVTDKPDAKPLVLEQGDIRFEHVGFSYQALTPLKHQAAQTKTEQKWQNSAVLDNLNLHIKAGEKIGLVGRSGAGKSTLVNLLLRFYDVQHGKILIDGQNIAEVSQDSLRAQIAMVTQDTSLLHRSIEDNILYGRPNADKQALEQAIIDAEAASFIDSLSDAEGNTGLAAQVGERGVKLSGGQRQRIAIARVLLKDAPILILDEATSALDSEVEAAIQDSLNRLMQGKTVIAIAHRLSTIAAMDRLVVMDKGKIIEMGTHDELLAKNGVYARLWARQTGGYLGDD